MKFSPYSLDHAPLHCQSDKAYLFANRRANGMKVPVHDSIDVWLAAMRLITGKFTWPK